MFCFWNAPFKPILSRPVVLIFHGAAEGVLDYEWEELTPGPDFVVHSLSLSLCLGDLPQDRPRNNVVHTMYPAYTPQPTQWTQNRLYYNCSLASDCPMYSVRKNLMGKYQNSTLLVTLKNHRGSWRRDDFFGLAVMVDFNSPQQQVHLSPCWWEYEATGHIVLAVRN